MVLFQEKNGKIKIYRLSTVPILYDATPTFYELLQSLISLWSRAGWKVCISVFIRPEISLVSHTPHALCSMLYSIIIMYDRCESYIVNSVRTAQGLPTYRQLCTSCTRASHDSTTDRGTQTSTNQRARAIKQSVVARRIVGLSNVMWHGPCTCIPTYYHYCCIQFCTSGVISSHVL